MAVAAQYPSPFPSYTEQYLDGSSSTDVHGSVSPQSMAYWTGGPSADVTPLAMPSVHPPTSEDEHTDYSQPPVIHRVGQQENYMLTSMGSSLVIPSSSPVGSTDSSMQVFHQNFGPGFAFYDSVPGAGMPEGFYAASRESGVEIPTLNMLGQTELRKATKKQPVVNAAPDVQMCREGTQQHQPSQPGSAPTRPRVEKKKFFPCC